MRKITLLPAVALSLMTFGVIAEAVPASAAPSAIVTGEDNGDQNAPPPTFSGTLSSSGGVSSSSSGGGSGSATPSGGAFTGAGGTAVDDASNVAPFLAAGGAGLGLLALSAAMRRRRTAEV
jgi:hypothetical protein